MTSDRLSHAYLQKADIRIQALEFIHSKGGYSDVVRAFTEILTMEEETQALLRATFGSIHRHG